MKPALWISEREPLIPEKEMQKFLRCEEKNTDRHSR